MPAHAHPGHGYTYGVCVWVCGCVRGCVCVNFVPICVHSLVGGDNCVIAIVWPVVFLYDN